MESGIVIILLQQQRIIDRQHRPLDRLVTLQAGEVPVRVGASVPIYPILQHQIFNHGRIVLIDLPDGRIIA